MVEAEGVGAEEKVGRRISYRSKKKKVKRSTIINAFLLGEGIIKISVDRVGKADRQSVVRIAEKGLKKQGRTFQGWAEVAAEKASRGGRTVVASPIPGCNPHHADIVLPAGVAGDRTEQKRHAQELADSASWCPA